MTTEELFYRIGIVAMSLWIILIVALTIGLVILRRKIQSFQHNKYRQLLTMLGPRKAELLGAAALALFGFVVNHVKDKLSPKKRKRS